MNFEGSNNKAQFIITDEFLSIDRNINNFVLDNGSQNSLSIDSK
jgi:hypothetical protein